MTKADATGDVDVLRPRWIRIAAGVSSVVVVVLLVGSWFALSVEVRATFDWVQFFMLAAVFGSGLAILWAMYRTRVELRDEAMVVVNGFRTHRYAWASVVAVSLGVHKPWAQADLADGTTISLMALQSADGDRARASVRMLARAVDERSAGSS